MVRKGKCREDNLEEIRWMMASTKIWGEMTRKVGVSPPMLEPEKVQARVSVGSNCQAGVSSIASQVGSRSPGPRWESDPGFLFLSFAYSWQLLPCEGRVRQGHGGRKTFACYFRPTHLSPHFSLPSTLHYFPIKHPPPSLPLPNTSAQTDSKLDRNCGKKPQKQMLNLITSSRYAQPEAV